jgi:hypothetical protein
MLLSDVQVISFWILLWPFQDPEDLPRPLLSDASFHFTAHWYEWTITPAIPSFYLQQTRESLDNHSKIGTKL